MPVEKYKACSCKKLAIWIFFTTKLKTSFEFWISPVSFQWQREKKRVGMANDRGQEEERGRTLGKVTVGRTRRRLVEGVGRATVVGFHVRPCHPRVTPPTVPGCCWDQLGDNQQFSSVLPSCPATCILAAFELVLPSEETFGKWCP